MSAKATKRKGSPVAMDVDSGSTSKKPRTAPTSASPSKSSSKHKPKSSSKARHGADGEFRSVAASLVLAVPPVFASRPRDGAEEMLDSLVMRYDPTLRGVVLAHSRLQFLERVGRIHADSPFAVCTVGFEALVWSPAIGMKLSGRINLSSPDHVSLLVHRTFNVSIPRHHLPTNEWEFEYGAAENDPEYGATAHADPSEAEVSAVVDGEAVADEGVVAEGDADTDAANRGRWVHKVTGEPLGGKERQLDFTIVGLMVANQMLSLVGSIQPDPLSPNHVPIAAERARSPPRAPSPPLPDAVDAASDEEEEEEDVFAELMRQGANSEAAQKAEAERAEEGRRREKEERKRAKEEKRAATEEKKRKRKEGSPEKKAKRSKA
ncbi:hypothetical protein FA95DRAFT_1560516 [Auriscalpium vulgare]|uniref:Uncharacterized protein n=1 Tax=Auriscalpium vulgare TaxID=40419 RepID=A0ACB8RPQ0_9AGAM|nr:hypothetical protein FA95DRAFT_1560516 [Auriscalpium vulgare]